MDNSKAPFGSERLDMSFRPEPFGSELKAELLKPKGSPTCLKAEGLVDMSHGRGATRLELVDKSLGRLMVEMHSWSQLLLGFSEEILVNRARKMLSNQIRLYKLNIKTVLNLTH